MVRRRTVRIWVMLAGVFILTGCHAAATKPDLGPQSKQATGELSVLMVAVRFPDAKPGMTHDRIKTRVTGDLDRYIREQSYGQAWVKADFRGWVDLPDSLEKYKVSPYNFKVDRTRVRKLVEDTMTALEGDVDFSRYQHILIVPGVNTTPGKGYGMICYCANPGMLTGVKGKLAFTTVRSRAGKEFSGGVFVGAENAHLGMYAHDFFHALGGIEQGRRLAP
jgi:M6 family metalloprotease-like protein